MTDRVPIEIDTPMMRQFRAIKADYLDAILFFRLGDFYEMFLRDAEIASKELDLTLTGRGKDDHRVPMCGIPYHAADAYIAKLVERGYKVAICEQVEDPSSSKGITRREVVKVVTPGTILDDSALDATENNFLTAICTHPIQGYGVSFVDISTGEFRVCHIQDSDALGHLLAQLGSKEVILPDAFSLPFSVSMLINQQPFLTVPKATQTLLSFFKQDSLSAWGLDSLEHAMPAAAAILSYLERTHSHACSQLTRLLRYSIDGTLRIDPVTLSQLELLKNATDHTVKGSLFWILNATKTAMGARKLRFLIQNPSTDIAQINGRLDSVEALSQDLLSREEIRECLSHCVDLERLLARIVSNRNHPRELIALKDSLLAVSELGPILSHLKGDQLSQYATFFMGLRKENSIYHQIITLIQSSILEDPPMTLRDGNVIRPGFNAELDALMITFRDIRNWIHSLEEVERKRSGIKSLKVGFNKVFGYYFNVPHSYQGAVPDDYIRKQTLSNAERYITPELKEKENILLHGQDKQIQLETDIYQTLVDEIRSKIAPLQKLSQTLAQLDCLQSFATVSQKNGYSRPSFAPASQGIIHFKDNRHPLLEKLHRDHVISNTITMSTSNTRFILITGPNMAGKSTLMRQVAITVIMAQMGCFVPASFAELSIVDQLFTRIGASDNLRSGQSTFMLEMMETASILKHASSQSLILLDEIGRGTSTYDGMSIAAAITDYIHNTIQARTLFATHYHELTELASQLPGLQNKHMSIIESQDSLIFTYQLKDGPADKSYGIHVAKMAGLPDAVITRAEGYFSYFEQLPSHSLLSS